MNKKIFSLLSVFLVVTLLTSPVSAGGNIGLKRLAFSTGSINASAVITGLGGYPEGVRAELSAGGIAIVSCTNQGGNEAPGQNPNISATGEQIVGPQDITKKGTAPLDVTAEPGPITAIEGGCPNNNWSAVIVNVLWTNATLTIYDAATNDVLLEKNFICDPELQTSTSVSCTEVN